MTKTCTKCGEKKPLDEYHKNKSRKDGRREHCKECIREYNRTYYEVSREEIREQQRTYYEANRGKVSEYGRAYYAANQEEIREKRLAYQHENRDFMNRNNSRRREEMNDLTHLTATRNGKSWEQWEDDFIANHPEMTNYQIATHIGRTHDSTQKRKAELRRKGALRRESAASD